MTAAFLHFHALDSPKLFKQAEEEGLTVGWGVEADDLRQFPKAEAVLLLQVALCHEDGEGVLFALGSEELCNG